MKWIPEEHAIDDIKRTALLERPSLDLEVTEEVKTIGLKDVVTSRRLLASMFATAVLMSCMSFGPAILAPRVQEFGVSKTGTGLVFALPLVLAGFSPLVVNRVTNIFENRLVITCALFFAALSFLLIGPSAALGFENELWVMCIGLTCMGFFCGTSLIPLLPDVVSYVI